VELYTNLVDLSVERYSTQEDQVIYREVKLEATLNDLIVRGGYSRNRQAILDSIGVTAAALSQYTRGRTRPTFQNLVALADFFGVSLDFLVYGEPVSATVDHGPIARYVEQAMTDVQSSTRRHSDLVARVGRLLADRINDVARELSASPSAGMEGLIELEESRRVERYCRQADIVTHDMASNIIDVADGEVAEGQFFQVVTANLARGCKYRFLLTGDLGVQSDSVVRFREMIADAVGGDRLNQNCAIRRAVFPIMSGCGLYELDTATLALEDQGLFTQFSKYLLNGAWLGYLNRPNADSNADMLMSPDYTEYARATFETLWSAASARM
jgi:transcriptional regulator with XRE-family HTH domain